MPDHLSMRETLACIDHNGRVRCPWCQRFARLDDLQRTPAARGSAFRVSLAPRCGRCREQGGRDG